MLAPIVQVHGCPGLPGRFYAKLYGWVQIHSGSYARDVNPPDIVVWQELLQRKAMNLPDYETDLYGYNPVGMPLIVVPEADDLIGFSLRLVTYLGKVLSKCGGTPLPPGDLAELRQPMVRVFLEFPKRLIANWSGFSFGEMSLWYQAWRKGVTTRSMHRALNERATSR